MAVKIRLKRMGKIRAPFYRVVVMDSRTKRDGRAIEEIGKYHPTNEPSLIEIDSARAQYWLGVGAQPTDQVLALLKVTGDWQKYKGLPGAEGTLKVAPPPPDRRALYEAAMAAAGKVEDEHAKRGTTARKRAKAEETPAGDAQAPAAVAQEAPAEAAAESAAPAEAVEQPEDAPTEAAAEAAPESPDAADKPADGA